MASGSRPHSTCSPLRVGANGSSLAALRGGCLDLCEALTLRRDEVTAAEARVPIDIDHPELLDEGRHVFGLDDAELEHHRKRKLGLGHPESTFDLLMQLGVVELARAVDVQCGEDGVHGRRGRHNTERAHGGAPLARIDHPIAIHVDASEEVHRAIDRLGHARLDLAEERSEDAKGHAVGSSGLLQVVLLIDVTERDRMLE